MQNNIELLYEVRCGLPLRASSFSRTLTTQLTSPQIKVVPQSLQTRVVAQARVPKRQALPGLGSLDSSTGQLHNILLALPAVGRLDGKWGLQQVSVQVGHTLWQVLDKPGVLQDLLDCDALVGVHL